MADPRLAPDPVAPIPARCWGRRPHRGPPPLVTWPAGTPSLAAGKQLTKLGFTKVYEMKGGMFAWKDQSLPVSKKRG